MAGRLQALSTKAASQLCSGQVITQLHVAVKELVENALVRTQIPLPRIPAAPSMQGARGAKTGAAYHAFRRTPAPRLWRSGSRTTGCSRSRSWTTVRCDVPAAAPDAFRAQRRYRARCSQPLLARHGGWASQARVYGPTTSRRSLQSTPRPRLQRSKTSKALRRSDSGEPAGLVRPTGPRARAPPLRAHLASRPRPF